MSDESYWSYKPAGRTPTVHDLPAGAIAPGTTQAEFEKLSPGMRREIERSFLRQQAQEAEQKSKRKLEHW